MQNKILFLTSTSHCLYTKNIDIVLSPEFYWVRIFNTPINKKKDILRVIPTFFEDFMNIEGYKFYIKKLDTNKYLCFAYNDDIISKAVKNANLTLNQVANIHFAQNEFVKYDFFKVDDNYFIYQDNILLKVPKAFVNSNEMPTCNMDDITLSKHKIYINKTNKYIDNKSLYILSTIFLIIAFINFTKINIVNDNVNRILQNQKSIKKQYKMLPTMMQTKSVIKALEKKTR